LEGLRRSDDHVAWKRFSDHFRPLIVHYARGSFDLSPADAEDAAQESLTAFYTAYRQGEYEQGKGRLSNWLFGIATNRLKQFVHRKAQNREVQADGTSTSTGFLTRVPDDATLERRWDEQWRRASIEQCMDVVRRQFDDRTLEAFQLFAVANEPARDVADRLGMTMNAVFLAKHRVLKRFRELLGNLEGTD
jgi:RNA polymerase sigma-70 factor (ECF subfamily)